jgi:putative salt-induced outer membrane protein YdiY
MVEDGSTVKGQALLVKDIAAINPPEKPRPKWTGQLSAGWTSTHGNTKADNQSFSFSAAKRTEKDRTTVSTDYVKGRQEDTTATPPKTITTEDWWRAKAKYDYFLSKKVFAYVDGRYEKDSIALLDRRVALGGGSGYQFKETDHTSLSGEMGLASLYEKFDDTTATTNSELSLQMGYNLTHRINETLHFSHDLTYYPNTEKFSDYYLTTTAELRANLTKKFFSHVKAIFNYDATPAPGKGGTDVKYVLGVGLDF